VWTAHTLANDANTARCLVRRLTSSAYVEQVPDDPLSGALPDRNADGILGAQLANAEQTVEPPPSSVADPLVSNRSAA
jgi:hypothetical protein